MTTRNQKITLAGTFAGLALSASGSAFAAQDVLARNCEIFIDKAYVTRSSHAYTTLHTFIKILPDHLDGPVARVGVVHSREERRSDRAPDNFTNRWDTLPSFAGSSDYFEFTSVTGHDWMSAREEASFFVETSRGTRYWLNQFEQPGLGFVFDGDLSSQVQVVSPIYPYVDVGARPKTADYPSRLGLLLNPRSCR